MKEAVKILVVIFCVAIVLSGCSQKTKTVEEAVVSDTLRIHNLSCPITLDPNEASGGGAGATVEAYGVIFQIYDGLFEYYHMDINDPRPCLAESYEISDDNLTWTFHLKQGVKFHNGDEMTADDVAFSINQYINSPVTSSYAVGMVGAEVIDTYTVLFKLSIPFPEKTMKQSFANYAFSIVNKKLTEEYKGTEQAVVGTGAYKLKEWKLGESVVLEANEDYFRGSPAIKHIIFRAIGDLNAAAIAFRNNELDLFPLMPVLDARELEKNPDFKIYMIQRAFTRQLAINNLYEPLKDIRVRQAINYAIDKQGVNLSAEEGVHDIANIVIPPSLEGYTEDVVTYEYNPEKARALLAEAGYDEKNPLKLTLTYFTEGVQTRWATSVQAYLSDVGIIVEPLPMETAAWLDAMVGRKYQIGNFGGGFSPAFSTFYYYIYYHSTGLYNLYNYSNPEVDGWISQAYVELNDDTRCALLEKVNKKVAEDAVSCPMYYLNTIIGTNSRLKGVYFEPQNYCYEVFDMYFE